MECPKPTTKPGLFCLIFILSILPTYLRAQTQQKDSIIYLPLEEVYKREYKAIRITGSKPVIDGKIDETFWKENGVWSEQFIQVEPFERSIPAQKTRMKLLYDEKSIYIAVICEEISPEAINRFLGNRDEYEMGDYVCVAFDPYHDARAATQFILNAGGNKSDMIVTDDMSYNMSWNAVWEGRTYIDQENSAWYAEFRIPLSQLRYSHISEEGVWGLHLRRVIYRSNEIQDWSLIPKNRNGYVYSFGQLTGMNTLPRAKGAEIMPYTMGGYQHEAPIAGNPYMTGNSWNGNVGLDAKVSLSDYTLDITVNPDYGQVELDPSVMNLSASETFYDEKRPFFLEGRHIFNMAGGWRDQLFYTRRVGSMPSYRPDVDNETSFAQTQRNVPIIAALKLTGTGRKGLTLGIQQIVTAQTLNKVTINGEESKIVVEPLTSFTVARAMKNWGGDTRLGAMVTFTGRDLTGHQHLEELLPRNALTAGVDFINYFKNRLYYVEVKGMFSTIHGSEEAILRKQLNSVHYFQRESSQDYLKLDPTRRSLSGTGGSVEIGRKGDSKWNISESISWNSPEFDLNDAGFLSMADQISNSTNISYTEGSPWLFFRSNSLSFSQRNYWDFGGDVTENNFSLSWNAMTVNRIEWTLGASLSLNDAQTRLLRGGPGILRAPTWSENFKINTDKGKKLYLEGAFDAARSVTGDKATNSLNGGLFWRAGNHLFLSAEANCQWNRDAFQYITTIRDSDGKNPSYIMGEMVQRTYGLTLKTKVNLTPDLSIQLYASPFTSTAHYDDFKEAADTRSKVYEERFNMLSDDQITFRDPDFRFNEFRSNIVIRWEYRPGSTLYFVWEHSRSAHETGYFPGWAKNLSHTFGLPSVNTFMVKLNYWLSI